MSYTVMCTFDLKNATQQDYNNAYSDLAQIGMRKVVVGVDGNGAGTQRVIPTTTVIADNIAGTSSDQVATVFRNAIGAKFRARRLKSEIFVVAGAQGFWAADRT